MWACGRCQGVWTRNLKRNDKHAARCRDRQIGAEPPFKRSVDRRKDGSSNIAHKLIATLRVFPTFQAIASAIEDGRITALDEALGSLQDMTRIHRTDYVQATIDTFSRGDRLSKELERTARRMHKSALKTQVVYVASALP